MFIYMRNSWIVDFHRYSCLELLLIDNQTTIHEPFAHFQVKMVNHVPKMSNKFILDQHSHSPHENKKNLELRNETNSETLRS